MGLLIDGVWHDQWYDTKSSGGKFKRTQAKFRNWITADGSAGASGTPGFKAEPGRSGVSETLCMRLSPCAFDGSFIEPFWV